MTQSSESRMWQVLGSAFIVGGALPLVFVVLNTMRTWLVDIEELKVGLWCASTILIGVGALAAARIVSAREGRTNDKSDWIWTMMAFGGLPAGAAMFDLEWERAMGRSATLNDKAVLLTGGFIFVAGLVALITERVVHRIQSRAITRALDEVEQAHVEAASVVTSRIN